MHGRRTSKYRPQQTALWEGEVMIILAESQEALDIDLSILRGLLLKRWPASSATSLKWEMWSRQKAKARTEWSTNLSRL